MTDSRHRRSIRYPGYDYSNAGAYFVTICAENMQRLFGEVEQGEMKLKGTGEIVGDCWRAIPEHFPSVKLDDFIVMPNHFHGIIWIHEPSKMNDPKRSAIPRGPPPGSLSAIIGSFKSASARLINAGSDTPGKKVWQRNYFERIIRDEDELMATRNYIRLNPHQWREDEYFT